jgi:ubiquitin-protein ligase
MKPRERRLLADYSELQALVAAGRLELSVNGPMPEHYVVSCHALGLAPGHDGRPVLRHKHRFELYLPLDYPRHPPIIAWQTPIFHPDILPPEAQGGVCFDSWTPATSLAEVCTRLIRMVEYREFDLANPLNREAAKWAREQGLAPGSMLEKVADAA